MTRLGFTFQMTVAALAVLLIAPASIRADLVNGSFEDTPLGTGWTSFGEVSFGGGAAILSENPAYPTGEQVSYTSIQQTFTWAGETSLSFGFRLTPLGGETEYFNVLLNDAVTGTNLLTAPIASTDYSVEGLDNLYPYVENYWRVNLDLSGIASENAIALVFSLKGWNDDRWAEATIDDVSLVPIPGAVVLGTIGLTLSGWLCRRKTC